MTDQQKKYKEIAVAFYGDYKKNCVRGMTIDDFFDAWLLTEEGKRLTAEEDGKADKMLDKIATSLKQLNDNQIIIIGQIDRFEGRLTVSSDDIKSALDPRITNHKE